MDRRGFARPFDDTWWVVPGQLLAGPYPGSLDPVEAKRRPAALFDAGIRTFLNLQEPDEKNREGQSFPDYVAPLHLLARARGTSVQAVRLPIPDLSITSAERVGLALDLIDASLTRGLPVYVHCWGGRGRTGTVIGCWLRRHGAGPREALDRMGNLRRSAIPEEWKLSAPEVESQVGMVLGWSEPASPRGERDPDSGLARARRAARGG